MSNLNNTKRGTQATGLGFMISVLLIANMGDPIVILRMLAALFSGTWMTILATTTIKDQNAKHGPAKTIILHYTAILGATYHKKGIEKNDRDLGRMC